MAQTKYHADDFKIQTLGEPVVDARQFEKLKRLARGDFWVSDRQRIPYQVNFEEGESLNPKLAFEKAGARQKLFFNPRQVRAGIVTCGGICPGLNDVIRALYMELHYIYGVPEVLGFRYGLRGLNPEKNGEPLVLTHDLVSDIHTKGGTVLGTSRGREDPAVMVAYLRAKGVNMLFVIGGDGSQRAAHAIWEAARDVAYPLAIVGIPKTIDNDINYVYKTFGFDTAVSFARETINSANIEAKGNPNGIGLVKVMGRDSGFIAAFAALATITVNYTLIPEVPFELDGPEGLLSQLEERIVNPKKRHAVIVVAEGAGQHLIGGGNRVVDPSGNVKHADIGLFLRERINEHFRSRGIEVNLKYFDPSYMLRSLPANANDSIFASKLAKLAVHAGMAGKTDLMIGRRFNQFIHVPIPIAVATRKKINPRGELWMDVLQSTGQPCLINERGATPA